MRLSPRIDWGRLADLRAISYSVSIGNNPRYLYHPGLNPYDSLGDEDYLKLLSNKTQNNGSQIIRRRAAELAALLYFYHISASCIASLYGLA
jgi:hypothetical protein